MKKQRIQELDYMKGSAIILVIMGHVVQFSLLMQDTNIVGLIGIFHMPIFFTVSGYLSYKCFSTNVCVSEYIKKLAKRSRILLIPLIIWSLVSNLMPYNVSPSISVIYRGGYWFFYSLWWCDIINTVLSYISNRFKSTLKFDLLLYAIVYAIILVGRVTNIELGGFLPTTSLQYYFPFFIIGLLMKKYEAIQNIFLNKYSYAVGLLIVLIGWYFRGLQSYPLFALAALGAVIVAWMSCKEINPDKKIAKALGIVGRNTLPIYAIHYFFIAELPIAWHNFVNVPMGFFFQFVIALCYSLIVVLLCLVIDRIISFNPLTRMLFFGETKKREW